MPATSEHAVSPGEPPRREILKGLTALLAWGCAPAALAQGAAAQLTPARFAALSTTLVGNAYADPALAARMLSALTAAVGADALAKIATLAAVTSPAQLQAELTIAGVDRAAATVVAALMSGMVETPKGMVVLAYNDALAWRAVPWTKPNAVCGGMVDYWATAPGTK
ncbi:MAG: sugar dehydrogenase complex small subunit [Burkholderiales bacterium]